MAFVCLAGEFYNQLVGSERAALPSIESQVTHLKDEICLWVSGAIEGAADVDFCTEDPLYAESRDQVRYLCNQSTVTQGHISTGRVTIGHRKPTRAVNS